MATKFAMVKGCEVSSCAYNKGNKCHTMAITIGEGSDPMCDTFMKSHATAGMPDVSAYIGACKMGECVHNKSYECTAKGVEIGMKRGQPDCLSFATMS